MKKRVFAMLMAAVMAFSLVACGNKTDNGGGDAVDGLLNGIAVVAVGVDRDDASHNILLFRRGPPSAAPEAVDKPSRRRSRREK